MTGKKARAFKMRRFAWFDFVDPGQDGIQLMTDAISGDDLARQGAALQVASTLKSEAVTHFALARFVAQNPGCRADRAFKMSGATR